MHDMAITRNYSILLEFPLCFEMSRATAGQMPYKMDYSQPSRFGVFARHAMDESAIQWFEGTPMMAFHIANCWEEGTDVIKLVGTPNRQFDFDFAQSGKTALYEWCFELSTGRLTERPLNETNVEFPNINSSKVGLPSQYVYAAVFTTPDSEVYSPFHAVEACCK